MAQKSYMLSFDERFKMLKTYEDLRILKEIYVVVCWKIAEESWWETGNESLQSKEILLKHLEVFAFKVEMIQNMKSKDPPLQY